MTHDHEGTPNPAVCPACYAAEGYAAADADRAVIARIGGNVVRRNPRLHDPSTIEAFARADLRARYRRDTAAPMLPEAAFDWPVYRAALAADVRRIETLESFADSNRDDYATHVRGWFDADTVRAVLPSGEWGTVDG